MATALVVCSKCRRHVRESERRCPFCASSRPGLFVAAAALTATVALSACATSATTASTPSPNAPAATETPAAAPTTTSTDATPPAPPVTAPAQTPPPAGSLNTVEVNAAGVYGPPPQPAVSLGNTGPAGAYGPPPGSTPSTDPGWVQVSKVEVDGSMATQDVLRVVRQNSGHLRTCYQVGLRDDPNKVSWTATVSFQIDELGHVLGPRVDGGDVPGDRARACLTELTRRMAFPPPPRGSSLVNVRYEVTLAPAPRKPPQPHF